METFEELKEKVDNMSHLEMCRLWRFHPTTEYSPYFDRDNPICDYFYNRLYKHFGGFTPQISKWLGWR